MEEKIKKILTLINQWKVISIILLIGAGLFYWYEIRPSIIFSRCHKIAIDEAQKVYKKEFPYRVEQIEKGYFLRDDYDYAYKLCLRERGINK